MAFERRNDGIYLIPSLGGAERLLVKGGLTPDFSPTANGLPIVWATWAAVRGPGCSSSHPLLQPRRDSKGDGDVLLPHLVARHKHLLVRGSVSGVGFDPTDCRVHFRWSNPLSTFRSPVLVEIYHTRRMPRSAACQAMETPPPKK